MADAHNYDPAAVASATANLLSRVVGTLVAKNIISVAEAEELIRSAASADAAGKPVLRTLFPSVRID